MSNDSSIDISDTKHDVFGDGGSGNYIDKGPVFQLVSPSKEVIEEIRKIIIPTAAAKAEGSPSMVDGRL